MLICFIPTEYLSVVSNCTRYKVSGHLSTDQNINDTCSTSQPVAIMPPPFKVRSPVLCKSYLSECTDTKACCYLLVFYGQIHISPFTKIVHDKREVRKEKDIMVEVRLGRTSVELQKEHHCRNVVEHYFN